MFLFTYVAAVLATSFAVTAAVFLIHRRDVMHVALASYLLSAALWVGGNAAADISYTPAMLTLASQVAFFGGIFNLFCFILLVDLIIDSSFPSWRRLFLYGAPCFVLATLCFSSHGITDIHFPAGVPAQIVPGVTYTFALLFYLAALVYGSVRLGVALRREQNRTRRLQLTYVLIGLLITASAQVLFDVVLPLLGELHFSALGPIMSLFFAAGAAAAITRYKLLDIRIVVQRGLIYSLLLITIVCIYVSLVAVFGMSMSSSNTINIFFSAGITIVVSVFGTPVIERFFRRVTDRIFYKDTYDYATALWTLSAILYENVEFDDLIRESERSIESILHASSVRIIVHHSVSKDSDMSCALYIPIKLDGSGIGSIQVGAKRSGDLYEPRDSQLLETFAYQAATAFSRARLYCDAREHAAELEARVQARTKELSDSHARERQTINDIAHNLQTPLTILQTKLDGLKPLLPDDSAMHSLERSLIDFSDFVYDLLALARIEARKNTESHDIDLSLLMSDLSEEIHIIADGHGIRVETSITPGIAIQCDERQLREALMNIVSNALAYVRDDGVRVISITLHADTDTVCVAIKDTGMGISERDLPQVFDRFYRGTDMPNDRAGTGLGLAIAKRIIEQHGGTIDAESTLGSGTTITIRLPRRNRHQSLLRTI